MVATRGKKKTASSDKTLEEKEATENGLAETEFSDSLTVDVVEPNEDTQLGDGVGLVTDEARNENSGEMTGEEGEKAASVDNEDPSMPVTKPNGDDNEAESEENTFEDDEIDDQEDVLFEVEDEEEHFEHDNEERILDEFDVSEEEASEEDDGDAEVSGEEATEEDEVSEEEATKEENDEENNQEEKENAIQDKREAKGKEEGGGAKEHGIEKSEASLKNIKKSNEKTRKKKAQASRLKKVDSQDKPESSQKRKVKKRVESMGMIFMCSSETKNDCYQYKVLGLPESKKDIVEKIYTGMRLFLYDVDLKLMYGIYKAAGPGGYNIEPTAFKRQFPSQVRFKVMENCLPLAEEKFKTIIKANYFTRTKFDCKLNSEQVKKLCKLFTVSSKGHPSKKLGRSLKTEKQHIRQEKNKRQRTGKQHIRQEKNKRQRTGDKRRLPLREDTRQPERPLKRQKKVIIPAALPRQRLPAPLPVPSSYVYSRTDAYRRDRPLIPLDPYGARDPPRERNERYRDGRDPHLERRYAYRGGLGSHIDRPDPYVDDMDSYSRRRDPDPYRDGRDLFLEPRDLYRDERDPYIERRDSYRDGRDAYIERRDSYRDGRASYLERRVPYGDSTHSELYSTYRRPLSDSRDVYREDRGVELRDSYRRDEFVGRRVLHPLDSETRNHHDIVGRDAYLSDRVRPSYAETLYPSAYPSRADVYRL